MKTLQAQYGLSERQCFICRKSPKGRRVQLLKDGPKICETCAFICININIHQHTQKRM